MKAVESEFQITSAYSLRTSLATMLRVVGIQASVRRNEGQHPASRNTTKHVHKRPSLDQDQNAPEMTLI